MSAREALQIATRGGAEVLGRTDVGTLAPGMRADMAVWDVSGIESAGSWDPAALLLAGPTRVRDLFVEGRQVVQGGQVVTMDLPRWSSGRTLWRAAARVRRRSPARSRRRRRRPPAASRPGRCATPTGPAVGLLLVRRQEAGQDVARRPGRACRSSNGTNTTLVAAQRAAVPRAVLADHHAVGEARQRAGRHPAQAERGGVAAQRVVGRDRAWPPAPASCGTRSSTVWPQ